MSVIGCIFTFIGVVAVVCLGGAICDSDAVDELFDKIQKRVK